MQLLMSSARLLRWFLTAPLRWILRPALRRRRFWPVRLCVRLGVFVVVILLLLAVALRLAPPPITHTQWVEARRLGGIERVWSPLEALPAHVLLSAVAAEDARFCAHWGIDLAALRAAWADGAQRGGSTISQQTAKNVFLWQERSWVRKGLEAGFTVLIEALWGKRRIIEVYLNVAEFDEGVFGIEAAAQHYFGVRAEALSETQAARLMAVLPNPKARSASRPSDFVRRRARQILSGARTLAADGRGACVIR